MVLTPPDPFGNCRQPDNSFLSIKRLIEEIVIPSFISRGIPMPEPSLKIEKTHLLSGEECVFLILEDVGECLGEILFRVSCRYSGPCVWTVEIPIIG